MYFDRVDNNRVYFRIGTKPEYHANVDSNVKFQFIQVDHGWFNGKDGGAYILSRVPARMWKRGICEQNTQISSLSGLARYDVSYDTLVNIFNEDYAKLNYPSVWKTGALSKHFAVDYGGVLYFYRAKVGVVDNKTNVITLDSPLVKQEVMDLVRRKGAKFTVEVSSDDN